MMENREIISSSELIRKWVKDENNIDVSKRDVTKTLKKELNLSYKAAKKL